MGVDGGGGVEEGMMLARRSESVDLGSCRDVLACSWVTGGADPSGWFHAGVNGRLQKSRAVRVMASCT